MLNKRPLGKKSFTLIELMVVIVIIAILASIAVPMMRKHAGRARATEGVAALSVIRTAQTAYFMLHREYADNLGDLGLNDAELGGTYYGGAGGVNISVNAASFVATIYRIGDNTKYVSIDNDGNITPNY